MVTQSEALVSSLGSAVAVSAAHGATHYIVEGSQSITTPGVMAAGTAVFAATFTISYGGMTDLLPF